MATGTGAGHSRYTSTGAAVNSWPAELGAEPWGAGWVELANAFLGEGVGGGDEGGGREKKMLERR